VSDKDKRDAAVDDFAKAMKARLDEKAAQGYTGWDEHYPAGKLAHEIYNDAARILPETGGWNDKKGIDIANRAMMLWYRRQGAIEAATGGEVEQ